MLMVNRIWSQKGSCEAVFLYVPWLRDSVHMNLPPYDDIPLAQELGWCVTYPFMTISPRLRGQVLE